LRPKDIMPEPVAPQLEYVHTRVSRIPLPLPLQGLPEVNCYAIAGDHGITLIDPGFDNPAGESALLAGLQQMSATQADVVRIVATHAHRDHYGLAVDWNRRYGVEVLLGREERHTVLGFDPDNGAFHRQAALLRLSGAPGLADKVDTLKPPHRQDGTGYGPPTHWISDGDTIDCGGYAFTARATPGHTRGHLAYEAVDDSSLFSGDHLLPRITPAIGAEYAPEESPLTSYLASLHMIADGPALKMLPAHGHTQDVAGDRARELLAHHEERLKLIVSHVLVGASTPLEVADRMTWTRHATPLDSLETFHAMIAVLEVRAHLVHLAQTGQLTRRTAGAETYTAA
jgi:glyoxylase-like metal-dependent hydrolase (beta-lactamase superfamily II)